MFTVREKLKAMPVEQDGGLYAGYDTIRHDEDFWGFMPDMTQGGFYGDSTMFVFLSDVQCNTCIMIVAPFIATKKTQHSKKRHKTTKDTYSTVKYSAE